MRRFVMLAFVLLALPAFALNGRIIEQRLDSQRSGYTILKVWGSPYEMGFAQGKFCLIEWKHIIDQEMRLLL